MQLKKGAKPKSMKKTDRDYRLIRYARKHPRLSMQEIGDYFGISRQRVSVILKGED